MDKLSYALGLNIGQQLKEMGLQGRLDIDEYCTAIRDVLEGRPAPMEANEAHKVLENFFTEMEARRQAEARAEGEAFLNRNKLRPEVTTTASGLQYEVLAEGNGRKPRPVDTVRCHYEGTLVDGTVFDSSYRRGEPAEFGLQQVIAGWTEGLQLMSEGAKYKLYLPYQLAYGERGAGGSIPPYAALVFTVELLKVL